MIGAECNLMAHLRMVAGLSQSEKGVQQVAEGFSVQGAQFDLISVLGEPGPRVLGALAVQLPVEVLLHTTELHPVNLTEHDWLKCNCVVFIIIIIILI